MVFKQGLSCVVVLQLAVFIIGAAVLGGCGSKGDTGCDPSQSVEIIESENVFLFVVNCEWIRNVDHEMEWKNRRDKPYLASIIAMASASSRFFSSSLYAMYFTPEQYYRDEIDYYGEGLYGIAKFEMHEFEFPSPESEMEPWEIKNTDRGDNGLETWVNDSGQEGYTFMVFQYDESIGNVFQTIDIYMDDEDYVYVFILATPSDCSKKDEYVKIRKSFHINADIIDIGEAAE